MANSTDGILGGTVQKKITLSNLQSYDNGRILYMKEVTGGPSNTFTVFANNTIGGTSSITVNALGSLQLQGTTSNWQMIDSYSGFLAFSNIVSTPSVTNVYPSSIGSYINIDLSTISKNVVLPQPTDIAINNTASLFYTIKDVNGYASTNFLYVSPGGGATIDTTVSSILLSTNYVSLQVLSDAILNTWHIVGYYDGSP